MRPTGIIRTLPMDHTFTGEKIIRRVLYRKLLTSFKGINENPDERFWLLALPTIPRIEVLHCYLIFDGRIRWRLNVAGYEGPGTKERLDGKTISARAWAILTAPVVKPPIQIAMKGFRGFRYTETLWE